MAPHQVLIVDDHEPVRRSLMDLVSTALPDLECLSAASGEEAVTLAELHRPGLVLMDILLPGISGIRAARRIRELSPGSKVVIVSILDTAAHRADAMAAGAVAYVPKNALGQELLPLLVGLLADRDGQSSRTAHREGTAAVGMESDDET